MRHLTYPNPTYAGQHFFKAAPGEKYIGKGSQKRHFRMSFRTLLRFELRHYFLNAASSLTSASNSSKWANVPVMVRLQDKSHRTLYRTLETEALRYRKGKNTNCITLRPDIQSFLVWLHKHQDQKPHQAILGKPFLPPTMKEGAVMEIAMFHLLTCFFSLAQDHLWLDEQTNHLDVLLHRISSHKRYKHNVREATDEEAIALAGSLGFDLAGRKLTVARKALSCIFLVSKSGLVVNDLSPWIASMLAPSVSQACQELANLSNIPAFVTCDILRRTPLSQNDLYLQLDLWNKFQESIAKAYHEKTSFITSIVKNITFYCVQFDPYKLPQFISCTVEFLSSKNSGYVFKVLDKEFTNSLIYSIAFYFIQASLKNHDGAMCVIRAQEVLVKHVTHPNLNQQGFMGVVMAINYVSEEKAQRLLEVSHLHFPERSSYFHLAQIHVSSTPEQLLHSFNSGMAQYPHSASMWLVFVKKLQSLELLSERRAHKLLDQLLSRRQHLIISKDIVLTLLHAVESINGIEHFIMELEKAQLLPKFQQIVISKYMSLLYRLGNEKNVRKPYLDKMVRRSSNLECARFLFERTQRKTPAFVAMMLNGEVAHRPEEIFSLYCEHLEGKIPDQQCLAALLRACLERKHGHVISWGALYAPQVAVHEFKKYVAQKVPLTRPSEDGLVPSNQLWKLYIRVLVEASYLAELAEIIRWWEQVQFRPPKSTLLLLLRALPREFAERHIKHAASVPADAHFLLLWPWPTVDEL